VVRGSLLIGRVVALEWGVGVLEALECSLLEFVVGVGVGELVVGVVGCWHWLLVVGGWTNVGWLLALVVGIGCWSVGVGVLGVLELKLFGYRREQLVPQLQRHRRRGVNCRHGSIAD